MIKLRDPTCFGAKGKKLANRRSTHISLVYPMLYIFQVTGFSLVDVYSCLYSDIFCCRYILQIQACAMQFVCYACYYTCTASGLTVPD